MKRKMMIWICIFLITISFATSLGIRPAKTQINFDETKDFSGTIWVVNSDRRSFSMIPAIEGEMGQYITITTEELSFTDEDDALPIEFEIHLPEYVPPGESTANIVVTEHQETKGSGVVSSQIVLKHKIIINGPFPDKYIETKLNFHDNGDQIRFVSEVENKGKEDIDNIQTTFYVNDKKQEEQVLETEETNLQKKENKLLDVRMDKDLFQQGEFEVLAITKYDDQKIEMVKKLHVGKPEVEITYFDTYLIANKVNEYSMDLLNKWNKKIKNVFVEVDVTKDGKSIDQFRTKSIDIEAEITKRINDYFDAKDKSPGKYAFNMVVNFWNTYRMDSKEFNVELVKEGEIDAIKAAHKDGITGEAIKDSNNESKTSTIIWVLVGQFIIALLGFGGFFIFRKRKNNEFEPTAIQETLKIQKPQPTPQVQNNLPPQQNYQLPQTKNQYQSGQQPQPYQPNQQLTSQNTEPEQTQQNLPNNQPITQNQQYQPNQPNIKMQVKQDQTEQDYEEF